MAHRRDGAGVRVYLVGFMGVGKTTIGRALAKELNLGFLDLDRAIEDESGYNAVELFDRFGEEEFRQLEREALRRTESRGGLVIATGGGCFASGPNREIIQRLGTSVWLDVPFEAILERMSCRSLRKRPLMRDPEMARKLFEERRSSYANADLHCRLSGHEEASTVVERLGRRLREELCVT